MEGIVNRFLFTPQSTQGLMVIGDFICFTLEPRKDQSNGKPFCIDPAKYISKIMWSEKRKSNIPHLIDVPGFDAIEIHIGNKAKDTIGCTLVGEFAGVDYIGNSSISFNKLLALYTTNDIIPITYKEPF